MSSLETLQKKIKTTTDLRDIVSTMKSLSSVSILQYDEAALSLKGYRKNIRDGFHALLKCRPMLSQPKQKNGKTLVVVIGSDNGLVGRFNKEILEQAQNSLSERSVSKQDALFLTVGKRVAVLAENARVNLFAKYAISNSIKFVSSLSGTIIMRIYEAMQKHKVTQVEVFFHKREQGTSVSLEKIVLLPFSNRIFQELKKKPWKTNNVPMVTLPTDVLVQELIKEYLMIAVSSALTYSLAAEHHTRMINMQNAEKNIDERLEAFNQEYQQKRQDSITEELIDVVSGSEAIKKK